MLIQQLKPTYDVRPQCVHPINAIESIIQPARGVSAEAAILLLALLGSAGLC